VAVVAQSWSERLVGCRFKSQSSLFDIKWHKLCQCWVHNKNGTLGLLTCWNYSIEVPVWLAAKWNFYQVDNAAIYYSEENNHFNFLHLVTEEISSPNHVSQPLSDDRLLTGYLQSFVLSKLYLDNVFEFADTAKIPVEIFRHCPSVRVLSLKNNYLQVIPADIGRLTQLEKLYLTNNRLENW